MGKMTLSLSSQLIFRDIYSFLENIRRLRRGEKEMYKKKIKEKNERDAV